MQPWSGSLDGPIIGVFSCASPLMVKQRVPSSILSVYDGDLKQMVAAVLYSAKQCYTQCFTHSVCVLGDLMQIERADIVFAEEIVAVLLYSVKKAIGNAIQRSSLHVEPFPPMFTILYFATLLWIAVWVGYILLCTSLCIHSAQTQQSFVEYYFFTLSQVKNIYTQAWGLVFQGWNLMFQFFWVDIFIL